MSSIVTLLVLATFCADPRPESAGKLDAGQLVTKLAATDLAWHIDEANEVRLEFRGAALDVLRLPAPPIEELQNAALRGTHFPTANFVLAELVSGPTCALLDRSNQAMIRGIRFQFSRSGEGEWQATMLDEHDPQWLGFAGWDSDELFEAVIRRKKMLNSRKRKVVTLAGRRRDVVDQISNADVHWHQHFATLVPFVFGQTSAASQTKPSIEALLDALNDPERFVAAHLLLCKEFSLDLHCSYSRDDVVHGLYEGLRVEISAEVKTVEGKNTWTFTTEIPEPARQRAYLAKRWERITTSASAAIPAVAGQSRRRPKPIVTGSERGQALEALTSAADDLLAWKPITLDDFIFKLESLSEVALLLAELGADEVSVKTWNAAIELSKLSWPLGRSRLFRMILNAQRAAQFQLAAIALRAIRAMPMVSLKDGEIIELAPLDVSGALAFVQQVEHGTPGSLLVALREARQIEEFGGALPLVVRPAAVIHAAKKAVLENDLLTAYRLVNELADREEAQLALAELAIWADRTEQTETAREFVDRAKKMPPGINVIRANVALGVGADLDDDLSARMWLGRAERQAAELRDSMQRRDAELMIVHAFLATGNFKQARQLLGAIEDRLGPLNSLDDRIRAVFGIVKARTAVDVATGNDRDPIAGLQDLDLTFPKNLESRTRLMRMALREDVDGLVAAVTAHCRAGGEWSPEIAAEELAARGFADRLLETTRERDAVGRRIWIRIGVAKGLLSRLGLRPRAIWEFPVWPEKEQ